MFVNIAAIFMVSRHQKGCVTYGQSQTAFQIVMRPVTKVSLKAAWSLVNSVVLLTSKIGDFSSGSRERLTYLQALSGCGLMVFSMASVSLSSSLISASLVYCRLMAFFLLPRTLTGVTSKGEPYPDSTRRYLTSHTKVLFSF
jgi:hypothetical protein